MAHARARRRRERAAVGVEQRPAVVVHRRAVRVHVAAQVIHRPPVRGLQREARRVDPRQPGRVRARVGRVDVAAEVERLGLAGLHHRADPGRRDHRRAHAREEPPPRRRRRDGVRDPAAVAHARTAPRRRSAAASTDSSWAPVLNVPLASTVPSVSSATANGLPGTSAAAHASASATLVERPQQHPGMLPEARDLRRERPAQPAALAREHGQPERSGGRAAARTPAAAHSARRSPAPHSRPRAPRPAAPRAAASRPRAPARARRRRARSARRRVSASPIASHWSVLGSVRGSTGASASAAASSTARPTDAFPTRPLAPKHPHGAPARPAWIAPSCTSAAPAISSAAAPAAASTPAATATPSPASTTISPAHTPVAARAVQPIRGQRSPRTGTAGELQPGRREQHQPEHQTGDDRDHRVGEATALAGGATPVPSSAIPVRKALQRAQGSWILPPEGRRMLRREL